MALKNILKRDDIPEDVKEEIAKNIIEHKQAEQKLKESQHYIERIIESTPNLIYIYDILEHRNVHANMEVTNFLGYTSEQVQAMGSTLFENILHPDDMERVAKHHLGYSTAKENEVYIIEYRMKHGNGEWHWLRSREVLFTRNEKGEVQQILGSAEDVTERKHAEELLKESEERFRTLFEKASDGIIYISLKSELVQINESFARMHGYTVEEMRNMKLQDLDIEDLSQIVPERIRRIKNGEALLFEVQHYHKDGYIIDLEVSACMINLKNENLIVAFHRDITERKQAENALSESESRFREVLENSLDASYKRNLQTNAYEYLSPVFEKITGYTSEEFTNFPLDTVLSLMHPDDIPEVKRAMSEALSKPTSNENQADYRLKRKVDGEYCWLHDKFNVVRDEQGQPLSMIGSVSDITKRKQAEEALLESDAKHKKMITNISDVIAIMDKDGTIRYKSPSIEKWFGWDPKDLVDTNGWATVHPDDLERIQKEFFTLLEKDNKSKTVEYRYKCKDGSYKWIELTAINLTQDPIIKGVLMNYHDITGRKQAEAEHLRLQNLESLGVLAGGIAHDFNNILAVILGRASMALSYTEDGSIKNDLLAIEKASRRAIGLTQQLLTFAKGGAPEKCVIDIRKIIKDTTKFALSGSNVISKFNFKDSSTIDADPGQISQVIQNLVINANQAMPAGGTPMSLS